MPGRNIYFKSQIIAMRHNLQIVCHQLLYVLFIFICDCKYEANNFIEQIFFCFFSETKNRNICSFIMQTSLRLP